MKILFKAKHYSDVIYFDLPETSEEDKMFIHNLINSAKVGGEGDVDLTIQLNKKETKEQIKTTEED